MGGWWGVGIKKNVKTMFKKVNTTCERKKCTVDHVFCTDNVLLFFSSS